MAAHTHLYSQRSGGGGGGQRVQGYPRLRSKFETSLGYLRSFFKKQMESFRWSFHQTCQTRSGSMVGSTWWKKRTNPQRLSPDLHMDAHTHVHTQKNLKINKKYSLKAPSPEQQRQVHSSPDDVSFHLQPHHGCLAAPSASSWFPCGGSKSGGRSSLTSDCSIDTWIQPWQPAGGEGRGDMKGHEILKDSFVSALSSLQP